MGETNKEGGTSTAIEDCRCRYPHGVAERDCPDCDGTGRVAVDAPELEHWHSGPLRAGQFCAACDQEAA